MRRVVGIVLAAGLTAAIACGDFSADPEPAPDAGPEGSTPDSATTDTGGPDAGTDASSFCSAQDAAFCDDFDTPRATPTAPWDGFDVGGDGGGMLIPTDGGSSPFSFFAVGSGTNGSAVLRKVLPFAIDEHWAIDAALRIDDITSDVEFPEAHLFEIRPNTLLPGAFGLTLLVYMGGSLHLRLFSTYSSTSQDLVVTTTPVPGQWYRWHLEWIVTAGMVHLSTHFDVQATNPAEVQFNVPADFTQQTVLVGPAGVGTFHGGFAIDDVKVTRLSP